MPRHPPNALKSLDALITNVHPCLVHQPGPGTAHAAPGLMFPPASADGRMNIRSKKDLYVLDLPAAERSSSCVPRQSAIHGTVLCRSIPRMPGLRAMQANPFIHDVNQQYARSCKRRNWLYEVSTAKCRNTQHCREWWSQTGSNRRPEACKATALPTELRPHIHPARSGNRRRWWVWVELNYRPHAYQACALTT